MKKNNIKVSIVMPAYNAEKTITESIKSVLNQTYSNIELVVVDDGSKDNTINVLKKITDKRLKIISKKNEGPSIARNVAIENSTGNYIVFLDADDRLEKSIIEKLVLILKEKRYDVILFKTVYEKSGVIEDDCKFNSFVFTEKDIEILNKSIYNKFEKYNNIFGFDGVQGKIISRDLILNNNIKYPENTFRFEDAIFCKQVYQVAKDIYFLSEIGTYYVKTEGSICHTFNPKICNAIYNALEIFYKFTDDKQDFYVKCITSLSECEVLYYLNKNNNKTKKQLKSEYKEMLNRSLYKETLSFIDIKKIPFSYKIEVNLLKNGFIGIYLFLKKIYFFSKKMRGTDK